jgi:hypothetical protein
MPDLQAFPSIRQVGLAIQRSFSALRHLPHHAERSGGGRNKEWMMMGSSGVKDWGVKDWGVKDW